VTDTVLGALRRRLDSDPDGPFLDFGGDIWGAARTDDVSARLAGALHALGVVRGDRIATLLENSPEQVVSFFAAARLGAIQVPINTAYKGEFLHHVLSDSGARVLVIQRDLADRLDALDALSGLEHVLVVSDGGSWAELSAADPAPEITVEPGDIACIIYTAGTTGPSKGCMLPHRYVVGLAHQIARAWGRTADDIVITPLPLFHFNAISVGVVGSLVVGGSASIARRFSVSNFWPEVHRTGATIASLLGSLAMLLASADDRDDQHGHRLRLCAAAPMPPDTDRAWRERFGVQTFSAGFGLTEASLLSVLPAGQENRPGAAGRINTDVFEVKIVDDDDHKLPAGEVGEIACRARQPHMMFAGYWGQPEATAAATPDGWFHTGDLARVDEAGFLFFVDRKKDALRRRGENISSFELERTFVGHPDVADVAVHAVASDLGEDDVKVTAVLRDGATVSEEELCRWAVDRVPYFALPRYIEFRTDLPRNPVGRVLKYQLRDEGVSPSTWDRDAAGFEYERR